MGTDVSEENTGFIFSQMTAQRNSPDTQVAVKA
jgi:hypothetical protein